MAERMIVLFIVFSAVLAFDVPKLKKKNKREVLVYSAIIACALYLGLDFLLVKNLPGLNELLDWTLTGPAQRITTFLETSF